MISVSTNVAALIAQQNLNINSTDAQESIAKLSSGSRIVRPSDDASSLAIGNNLNADIVSLQQAGNNAAQGASMLQVANGAYTNIGQMLARMKVLATEVINGSLSTTDAAYAQQEFGQLQQQINSTAEQTRWNGQSLLTGGAGVTTYDNTSKTASGLNAVANGFAGTLNSAASGGYVNVSFGAASTINVTASNGTVSLVAGGETFQGSTTATANGVLVLTSTTNAQNKIALNFAASVSAVNTDGTLATQLKNALANSQIQIGAADLYGNATTGAYTAATPNANTFASGANFLNQAMTHGAFAGSVSGITVNGATNGDYTVSLQVGSETFQASSVTVSAGGTLTLTSTTNPGDQIAINYNSSNVSGVSNASTFQSALGTMFGTAGETFQVGNNQSAVLTATGVPANTLAGTLNQANTHGFINGVAQSASVATDGNAYDVSVVVGNQTFKAVGFSPSSTTLNLVSTSDSGNVISLDVAGGGTGITSAATLQSALQQVLGLNAGQSVATFQSASAYNNGYNGITMGENQSIVASSSTPPGTYALSYDASSKTFKLTDGQNIYTASPAGPGNQTVTFANGVALNLGSNGNSFDDTKSIGQMVFSVGQGTNVNLGFQVAEKATDVVNISFTSATTQALGLTGASINTVADATSASSALDNAINTVNTAQANLGATQSRFNYIQSTISTSVQNLTAAKGTFLDVDLASEQTKYATANTLTQASVAMLAQANQLPQELLKLLQ